MPCHGHSHGSHTPEADKWTNIAAGGEFVASLISDAYWLGNLFDLAAGFSADAIGLSYYGIGSGVAIALLSAGGSAYCHRGVNTVLQGSEEQNADSHAEPLAPSHKNGQNGYESLNDHLVTISDPVSAPPKKLSWMQKLALVGDFISHTGDTAGPITFVVCLATRDSMSLVNKILVQSSSSLFGAVCAVANVRACKNAMLEKTESEQDCHHAP